MTKITLLPPAGPFTGTEQIPLVQDGETRQAPFGDLAEGSAALAQFRQTIAEGLADFAVGQYFTSIDAAAVTAHAGQLRRYKRVATAPGYADMGDAAAPASKAYIDGKLDERGTNTATHDTFADAVAASANLFVPAGSTPLAASVGLPGSLSWRAAPGAVFTGPGALTLADHPGFYFTANLRNIRQAELAGTFAAPVTHGDPLMFVSKNSNFGVSGQQNAAFVAQHYRWNTTPNSAAQGGYFEVIDKTGNEADQTYFIEGVRSHAIGMAASPYGGIFFAQAGDGVSTPNARFVVGVEAETLRTAGDDAANPLAWTSANHLDVTFLATVRGGKKPMAGFMVNPFNPVPMQCGFLVGNSFAAQGVAQSLISFAAFATTENNVPHAFYAANCIYSVLRGPNNVPIRFANQSGGAEMNVLMAGVDNSLYVGDEVAAIRLRQNVIFTVPQSSTPGAKGEMTMERTSNTQLTLKLKGDDGVLRGGSITLNPI